MPFNYSRAPRKLRLVNVKSQKARLDLNIYTNIILYVANICQSLSNFKSFDIFSVFSSFDVFDLFCSVQPRRPEPNDRQSLYLPRISKGMEDLDGSEDSVSLP